MTMLIILIKLGKKLKTYETMTADFSIEFAKCLLNLQIQSKSAMEI